MAERFELYKREQVARFYQDHFRQYSRQIVLVDVLRALLAGRGAFDDTRLAPGAILGSVRHGDRGAPPQPVLRPPIDHVPCSPAPAEHAPHTPRAAPAAL